MERNNKLTNENQVSYNQSVTCHVTEPP